MKTLMLAEDGMYTLWAARTYTRGIIYTAGCRLFYSKEDAIKHWEWRRDYSKNLTGSSYFRPMYKRAVLFLDALERFDEDTFELRPEPVPKKVPWYKRLFRRRT